MLLYRIQSREALAEAPLYDQVKEEGYSLGDEHGFALSDRLLGAIGLTVVAHSFIEYNLGVCITRLAGVSSHRGMMMTAGMSFRALRGALQGLVLDRVAPTSAEAAKFRDIMARVTKFEEFRNQAAHSLWATTREDINKALRIKANTGKAGFRSAPIDVNVDTISHAIKNSNRAMHDLMQFVDGLVKAEE